MPGPISINVDMPTNDPLRPKRSVLQPIMVKIETGAPFGQITLTVDAAKELLADLTDTLRGL
jgi:hypothetical protein